MKINIFVSYCIYKNLKLYIFILIIFFIMLDFFGEFNVFCKEWLSLFGGIFFGKYGRVMFGFILIVDVYDMIVLLVV